MRSAPGAVLGGPASREPVTKAAAAAEPTRNDQTPEGEVPSKVVKRKGNEPIFDIESEQRRISGVDATTIDGIDVMTIQTVLAEVGPDLSAGKTERHWSSWLNLAPKRDVSGGRVIRHTREHRTNRVGNAFRMAAQSLIRSQSYLGARFRLPPDDLENWQKVGTSSFRSDRGCPAVLESVSQVYI